MFGSIAQRAWFAWHCLPRNDRGQPPSLNVLEREFKFSHAQLRKIVMGRSPRPGYATIIRAAEALKCDAGWLGEGEGPPPVCSVFVPPCPPARKKALAASGAGLLSQGEIVLFESKASQLTQRPKPVTRKRAR